MTTTLYWGNCGWQAIKLSLLILDRMTEVTGQGVGARVRRKEDSRFLRGRGNYVSDMILPGQSEVAFLRSPIAHGRIRRITKPPGSEGRVFVRSDLAEAAAMIAPVSACTSPRSVSADRFISSGFIDGRVSVEIQSLQ